MGNKGLTVSPSTVHNTRVHAGKRAEKTFGKIQLSLGAAKENMQMSAENRFKGIYVWRNVLRALILDSSRNGLAVVSDPNLLSADTAGVGIPPCGIFDGAQSDRVLGVGVPSSTGAQSDGGVAGRVQKRHVSFEKVTNFFS